MQDFLDQLPMPEYCNPRNGPLNLTTCYPDFTARPDLGPKSYVASGMVEEQPLRRVQIEATDAKPAGVAKPAAASKRVRIAPEVLAPAESALAPSAGNGAVPAAAVKAPAKRRGRPPAVKPAPADAPSPDAVNAPQPTAAAGDVDAGAAETGIVVPGPDDTAAADPSAAAAALGDGAEPAPATAAGCSVGDGEVEMVDGSADTLGDPPGAAAHGAGGGHAAAAADGEKGLPGSASDGPGNVATHDPAPASGGAEPPAATVISRLASLGQAVGHVGHAVLGRLLSPITRVSPSPDRDHAKLAEPSAEPSANGLGDGAAATKGAVLCNGGAAPAAEAKGDVAMSDAAPDALCNGNGAVLANGASHGNGAVHANGALLANGAAPENGCALRNGVEHGNGVALGSGAGPSADAADCNGSASEAATADVDVEMSEAADADAADTDGDYVPEADRKAPVSGAGKARGQPGRPPKKPKASGHVGTVLAAAGGKRKRPESDEPEVGLLSGYLRNLNCLIHLTLEVL